MKTNPSPKIFKYATFAAVWSAMALLTQSAMAQTANQLVFTENSSTSLTVTYNGSSAGIMVTPGPGTPDTWDVTFPSNIRFTGPGEFNWSEPGEAFFENHLSFASGPPPDSTTVVSDLLPTFGVSLQDETTVLVGSDTNNGGQIFATFDDDGDVATVPDTGSTFGLLFLTLVAILSATQLRSFRLA